MATPPRLRPVYFHDFPVFIRVPHELDLSSLVVSSITPLQSETPSNPPQLATRFQ
jgi:hypothetical protein